MTARSSGGRDSRTNDGAAFGDHVDALIAGWSRERPDLDVSPLAVVQRIGRLAAYFAAEIEPVFAPAGLNSSDFSILANLCRSGTPYQLNQRELMDSLRLTSGTVSVRIDHLSERGLVERVADPSDGRSVLVTLTEAGRDLFDALAPRHLLNEARLISALDAEEQERLATLLRALLVEFDDSTGRRPDERLGLRVSPAHVAHERRAAVGLPPASGLLVESVRPDGVAGAAGLAIGDVLERVGDVPLHSLTCLERALASHHGELDITVRRHERTFTASVDPGEIGSEEREQKTRRRSDPLR